MFSAVPLVEDCANNCLVRRRRFGVVGHVGNCHGCLVGSLFDPLGGNAAMKSVNLGSRSLRPLLDVPDRLGLADDLHLYSSSLADEPVGIVRMSLCRPCTFSCVLLDLTESIERQETCDGNHDAEEHQQPINELSPLIEDFASKLVETLVHPHSVWGDIIRI